MSRHERRIARGSGLRALWQDEDAPTAVEYALMVGLIAAVIFAAVTTLGVSVTTLFANPQLNGALAP